MEQCWEVHANPDGLGFRPVYAPNGGAKLVFLSEEEARCEVRRQRQGYTRICRPVRVPYMMGGK